MSPTQRNGLGRALLGTTLVIMGVWSIVPIGWLLVMATQPEINYTGAPLQLSVEDTSVGWLKSVLQDDAFGQSVANSMIISVAVTIIAVTFGAMAAYALARLRLPGKNAYLGVIIASRILPSMVLVVPIFLIARWAGLLDTHLVLIVVYTALLLPFSTWLLRNFFLQLSPDLERAARMDGCSTQGVLWRVVLPVAAPGVATTAIFCFIESWNSFLFALVLTRSNAKPITAFLGEQANSANYTFEATVSDLAAGGVLAIVPVVILVSLLHKHVVRGILPAVKG